MSFLACGSAMCTGMRPSPRYQNDPNCMIKRHGAVQKRLEPVTVWSFVWDVMNG